MAGPPSDAVLAGRWSVEAGRWSVDRLPAALDALLVAGRCDFKHRLAAFPGFVDDAVVEDRREQWVTTHCRHSAVGSGYVDPFAFHVSPFGFLQPDVHGITCSLMERIRDQDDCLFRQNYPWGEFELDRGQKPAYVTVCSKALAFGGAGARHVRGRTIVDLECLGRGCEQGTYGVAGPHCVDTGSEFV